MEEEKQSKIVCFRGGIFMNRKRWIALSIAAILFVFSIGVNFLSQIFFTDLEKSVNQWFPLNSSPIDEQVIERGQSVEKIAVLNLSGVIQESTDASSFFTSSGYNHRNFLKQMDHAKKDNQVKAIIIRVNTPGGGVVESAEIHDKIVEIQSEAKKPVYISMGSMAASGGYYISAPAHKIFAHPETVTGSLGVIMQGYNFSKLAEKYGVEFVTIKSGPYKDIMSSTREMTQEERKILQGLINNSYEGFVKVISEGRNIPIDEVRKIADGRIYDGRQAKELNLIDEFGDLDDVIEAVKKEQKLDGARVVEYKDSMSIVNFFTYSVQKIFRGESDVETLIHLLTENHSPRLMYLYSE